MTGIVPERCGKYCHGWLKQSSTPLRQVGKVAKRQDFITWEDKREKTEIGVSSRAVEIIAGLPTERRYPGRYRDRHGQGIWH